MVRCNRLCAPKGVAAWHGKIGLKVGHGRMPTGQGRFSGKIVDENQVTVVATDQTVGPMKYPAMVMAATQVASRQ